MTIAISTNPVAIPAPVSAPPESTLGGESRFLLQPISWAGYLRLLDEVGNDGPRMAYIDGMVELMAPDFLHEDWSSILGRMITELVVELGILAKPLRSSTFTKATVEKGVEADECFYLTNIEQLRGHKKGNLDVLPPPDLVVEVEITASLVNKLRLYAALGMPEIWRHDGRQFMVLLLQADGTYRDSDQSRAFPFLPLAAFRARMARFDSDDLPGSTLAYRAWIRDVVAPLHQAQARP